MTKPLLDELGPRELETIAAAIETAARAQPTGNLPTGAIAGFFGPHRFLSNFWFAAVPMHGSIYPTVEHAYQAAKATSAQARDAIRRAHRPAEAKKFGRSVPIRADWESVKLHYMLGLVRRKFCDPALAEQLLATGSARLFEDTTSWRDEVWGVTIRGDTYRGGNRLGRILEYVRDELAQGQEVGR